MSKKIEFLYTILITFLLVLVFTFPRVLQIEKTILLVLILFTIFICSNLKLKTTFYINSLIYFSIFIIPLISGVLFQNKFTYITSSLIINIVYPILLFLIFQFISIEKLTNIIFKSSFISIVITVILTINTLLYGFNLLPFNLNGMVYVDEQRIGIHNGYIHIINSPLSYLLFTIPVVFAESRNINFKKFSFYSFLLLIVLVIVSGRRILILPFLFILIINIKRTWKTLICISFFVLVLFGSNSFRNFDLNIVIDRFKSAINSDDNSDERNEQMIYFNKYINQRPITGHGLGAFMRDYKRNDVFEMAYERTYHFYAFSLGIPIFIILMLYYFFLFYKSLKNNITNNVIKNGIILGVLTVLLASYTNPYWLSSFDYCFPLAILLRFSQKNNKV